MQVLVWKVFALLQEKDMEEVPIIVENMIFKRTIELPRDKNVTFIVNIAKGSGKFEISESGSIVATGKIHTTDDMSTEFVHLKDDQSLQDYSLPLSRDDVYKECSLRRYKYSGDFQGVIQTNVHGLSGLLEWKGKFDSFLDTILHLSIIGDYSRELKLPSSIQRIVIDSHLHLELVKEFKGRC